ncbi:MAG: hypothetical protein MJZ68_07035, partial [archaeon]|nr:hypothetical protein [archaeon]
DGVGSADVLFTYGPLSIEVTASIDDGSADVDAVVKLLGRTATAYAVYENGIKSFGFGFDGTDNYAKFEYDDGTYSGKFYFAYGPFSVSATVDGHDAVLIAKLSEYSAVLMLKDGSVALSALKNVDVLASMVYGDGLELLTIDLEKGSNKVFVFYKETLEADIHLSYSDYLVEADVHESNGTFYVAIGESSAKIERVDGVHTVTITTVVGGEKLVTVTVFEGAITELDIDLESEINKFQVRYEKGSFSADVHFVMSDGEFDLESTIDDSVKCVDVLYDSSDRFIRNRVVYTDGLQEYVLEFEGVVNSFVAKYSDSDRCVKGHFEYGAFSVDADVDYDGEALSVEGKVGLEGRTVSAALTYTDSVQAYDFRFDGTDNHAYAVYKDGVGSFDVLFTYGEFYVKAVVSANDEFVDVSAETRIEGRTISAALTYADGVQAYDFRFDGTDNHAYAVYKDDMGAFDILFTYGPFSANLVVSGKEGYADIDAIVKLSGRTASVCVVYENGIESFELGFEGTDNHASVSFNDGKGDFDVLFTYGEFAINAVAAVKDGCVDASVHVDIKGRLVAVAVTYADGVQAFELGFEGTDNHAYVAYADSLFDVDILFTYGEFGFAVASKENLSYILMGAHAPGFSVLFEKDEAAVELVFTMELDGVTATLKAEFDENGFDKCFASVMNDGLILIAEFEIDEVPSYEILMMIFGDYITGIMLAKDKDGISCSASVLSDKVYVGCGITYSGYIQEIYVNLEVTDNYVYYDYKDGVSLFDVELTYGPCSIDVTNKDGELMAKVVYNGPGFTVQAHMVDQVSGVILSVDLDGVECDLSVNFDEHGFSDAEIAVETEDVTATFSVEMGETVEYLVSLEIEKEYGIVATFVKNGSGTTFTCEASYEDVTAEVHLFNFEGNVSVTVGSDTEATLVLKKESVDISIVVGTNYFKTYLGEDFQSVEVYFVVEEFEFRFGANNEKEPVLHMGVDYNGSNIANVTYEDGKFVAKALFKNDDLSVDIDIELPEPVMVSIDVVRSDNHYVKVEVSDTVDVDVDWSVMGVTVLAQVFTGESGLEGVVEIGSSEFTFFAEIEGDIFSVEFVYGYVALDVVSGYDSEVYTVCVELTVGLFKASGIYTADSTVLTAGYDDGTTVFEMEIVLDKAISLDISLVSGDNKCLVKADNGSGNIDIDWTVETVTVKLVDSIVGADSVGRLNIDAENVAFVLAFDRGDIRSTLDCLYSEFGLCASLTLSDETNGCSVTLVRGEDHAAMEYTDGVFIEDTVWKFENVKLEVDAEIGGESSTVCIVFENDVFKADLDYVDTTYKVVFTLTTDDYNVDFGLVVSDEEKKADLTVINHENSLVAKYLDAAVSVDVDWVIDEAKVTVDFEYDETVDGKISIDSDISHLGAVFDDSKVSFDLECPVRMYDLTLAVVVSDSLDLFDLDVKADERGVSVKYDGTAVEFDVSDTIGKTDVDGTVTYDGTVCYFDIEVSSEYFYLKAESNETFTCVKLIVDSVIETFDIDADDALLTVEYYSDESTTKLIITVNTGCADMAVSVIDGKVGVDIDATVCEVEIHVDATATEDDMVAYVEVSKQGNIAVMSYNEGNVKANLSYTVEELEIRAEYTYDGAHSASLYIQNGSDTCQIGYADKKYTIVLEETLLDSVHVSMDLSATTVLEEVNFSIASEGGELQFGYGDDGVNMTFEMSVEPLEMSVNVNIGDDTIVLVNCDYGENHFDLMFNEVLDINVNFETEDIVLNASVEYGGTEDSANISFTYGEYRFTMEYDEVEDFMDVFFTNGIYAVDVNVGDEIVISVAHERFALAVYYAFDNGAVGVVFETVGFTAGAAYEEGQFSMDLGYDYDGIFAEFSMSIGEGYAVGLTAGADSDRITVQVSDKGAFAQIDVTVYGFGVVAYLDTIDDSFKCSLEVKMDEYFVKLAYGNGTVIVGVNVVIETVAIDATVVVDKDVEFDIAVSNDNGLVKAKFDNEKTAVSFDIDRDGYDIVSVIVVTEDGTTLSFKLLKDECSLGISVLGGIIDVAVEVKTDDVQANAKITNKNVFTVNAEVVGYNSKFKLDVTPGNGYLEISTATDEFSCSIAVIYDGVHTVVITVGCDSGTCSVKISEDGTVVISKDDGTSASKVVIEGVDIDLDEKTFVADKVVVTVDGEDVVVVDKVEVTVKDSGIDASAESIEATVSETEIKTSVSGSVEFGESIKDVLIDVFTKGDLGAIVDAIESAVVEVKDVEGTYKGD